LAANHKEAATDFNDLSVKHLLFTALNTTATTKTQTVKQTGLFKEKAKTDNTIEHLRRR